MIFIKAITSRAGKTAILAACVVTVGLYVFLGVPSDAALLWGALFGGLVGFTHIAFRDRNDGETT